MLASCRICTAPIKIFSFNSLLSLFNLAFKWRVFVRFVAKQQDYLVPAIGQAKHIVHPVWKAINLVQRCPIVYKYEGFFVHEVNLLLIIETDHRILLKAGQSPICSETCSCHQVLSNWSQMHFTADFDNLLTTSHEMSRSSLVLRFTSKVSVFLNQKRFAAYLLVLLMRRRKAE